MPNSASKITNASEISETFEKNCHTKFDNFSKKSKIPYKKKRHSKVLF